METRRSGRGIHTQCRVDNRTSRAASSVVFTVELVSADGRVLASNPLANALVVPPGDSRVIAVPIPLIGDPPVSARTRAQVSLVRWEDD